MASISVTNTFSNGSTADASQVNQNFTDIINGTSDGTKDFSINALTCAGTATLNGNVNIGNASGDDLSITASLASSLAVKTNASYNVGSSTLGLLSMYLGNSTFTTRLLSGATSSWSLTFPATAGTARYRLETDGAGATSWVKSFTTSSDIRNASLAVSLSGNAMTIALKGADGNDPSATNPVIIVFRNATSTTGSLTEVLVTSALSVTVSSGSTLGTTSAVESKINVYAINNAGTVELAVANLGATSTDGRITTTAEGGAGAADSATVFYSTTARTNVACRLLGAVVSTQATAGTWATAITSILTVGCGQVFGSVMTDWTAFTPTITHTSGTMTNFSAANTYYRRIGDSYEIDFNITFSGSGGTFSGVFFTLPNSGTVDTNKVQNGGQSNVIGFGSVRDFGVTNNIALVRLVSGTPTKLEVMVMAENGAYTSNVTLTNAVPFAGGFGSSDIISARVTVPVVGLFARDWIVG